MRITLTKMCGAGNDFLITDFQRIQKQNSSITLSQTADYLKTKTPQLCHRQFGIGADGVCLLFFDENNFTKKHPHPIFQWQFWNSDGSTPDMCGNAACCIIHYVYQRKLIQKTSVAFQIKNMRLTGKIKDHKEPWLCLQRPQLLKEIKLEKTKEEIRFKIQKVDSGVPHLLVESAQTEEFEKLRELAKTFRKTHPHFNITFYKKIEKQKAFCVTFEKGVEDFTLACGTGALAVAQILNDKDHSIFSAQMAGGVLKVLFDKDKAYLHSPVHWIADVNI